MRLFRGPLQTAYIFKKKSNIPQGSNTANPNLNKTTTAARAKTIPKLKTIPNWNHPSSCLGAFLQPSTAMEQPIWRTVFFLITFSNGSINCNYLSFEGSLNISFYQFFFFLAFHLQKSFIIQTTYFPLFPSILILIDCVCLAQWICLLK